MKLVLLHGLGQTPAAWDAAAAALPGGVDCLCPDLTVCQPSYAALYQAVDGFCRDVREPLHLCGLSLGGVLALHYAIGHPEAVCSLTLIGAQYKMPRALLRFQNAVFRLAPAAAFQNTGFSREGMIRLTRSMLALNFEGDLSRVACPALILCGERDRANRTAARQLAERIPRARLTLLPGAGHEVNLDAPEALARELGEFFAGI